jgi:hypothetical protein
MARKRRLPEMIDRLLADEAGVADRHDRGTT